MPNMIAFIPELSSNLANPPRDPRTSTTRFDMLRKNNQYGGAWHVDRWVGGLADFITVLGFSAIVGVVLLYIGASLVIHFSSSLFYLFATCYCFVTLSAFQGA